MARYRWLILVLIIALAVLSSCAKKEAVPVETEVEKPAEEVPPPPPPLEEVEEPEEAVEVEEPVTITLEDIFFDFDKFNVRDEFKDVLTGNAEVLLAQPDVILLVEGHCDERGTSEYNLALGEKRAKIVMDFYTRYGIAASRLSIISYGEERPFDPGHIESAWAKNRRAHMVVK